MWKKSSILLCVTALAITGILAGAGTYANFGGPYTIDFSSPTVAPVISGLNPGETVHIVIMIPNPHYASILAHIRLLNVLCDENSIVEPEQEWYDEHSVRNDIDSVITFGLWIDVDGDTSGCNTVAGDQWIKDETEGIHINDIDGTPIPIGTINAGETMTVVTSYHMDEETENWAQSDTMTFDIEYTLSSSGAPGHKQEAIEELEQAKTGTKKIDEKIDKAIYHIERSLDEKYWVDDYHLDPKHGNKVFDEEKNAVIELQHLMDDKDTPPPVKVLCQSTIYKLIEADSTLAHKAYEDAMALAGNEKVDKELEQCEGELAKVDEELVKFNYEKAVDHCKKAWEHAQLALKEAP